MKLNELLELFMDKLLVLLAQISTSHVSNFVSGLSRHCSLIELFMPVNKAETGPVWELAIHTVITHSG